MTLISLIVTLVILGVCLVILFIVLWLLQNLGIFSGIATTRIGR